MHHLSKIGFSPHDAAFLASRCQELGQGAIELAGFAESEPELASAAGLEVAALEARSILASGVPDRISQEALGASQKGSTLELPVQDVAVIDRLEHVLAQSSNRIAQKVAVLQAAEQRGGIENFGAIIGVVGGAVGLVKSLFPGK